MRKLALAVIFSFTLSSASLTFAEENEKPWFAEALEACAEQIKLRGKDIPPYELYDLHLQSEFTTEEQKFPGWAKNSCKKGLEDWVKDQKFYKKLERFVYKFVPYLINPSVVIEKDEELKIRIAPPPSEPKTYPPVKAKLGLGISIKPGELIGGDVLEGFSPYLKADGRYYAITGKLRVHPLREIMQIKLGHDDYLFGIARPDISYKWQWGNDKKHDIETGLTFKTPYPELQARLAGSMNIEDQTNWSVSANLFGYWNWECVLLKWIRKCEKN